MVILGKERTPCPTRLLPRRTSTPCGSSSWTTWAAPKLNLTYGEVFKRIEELKLDL